MRISPKRLTKQECFDKAWKAFVVRKKPPSMELSAVSDSNGASTPRCLYRHPSDHAHGCAIGVCLLQWQKDLVAEHMGDVSELLTEFKSLKDRFPRNIDFLLQLQECHDEAADSVHFSSRVQKLLEQLANRFKLKVPAERRRKKA